MRVVRFIGLVIILCAGVAGQSDTQKRDRNAEILAFWKKEDALHHSLIDTFADCVDRAPKGEGVRCGAYRMQIIETDLDIFLSPELAATLRRKLSAHEIE